MRWHVFEARTAGVKYGNWGKFAVAQPGPDEWAWKTALPPHDDHPFPRNPVPLLRDIGWSPRHVWVFDLQTGEGAIFPFGGHAPADLAKHRIWVCPLFEPFLAWLYRQNLSELEQLPQLVELDAEFAIHGYRRPGPDWFGHFRVLPGPGICLMR
jgi:hypothetical protein